MFLISWYDSGDLECPSHGSDKLYATITQISVRSRYLNFHLFLNDSKSDGWIMIFFDLECESDLSSALKS